MHILYLARLVLVQLESKFKLCRFLYTENADKGKVSAQPHTSLCIQSFVRRKQ